MALEQIQRCPICQHEDFTLRINCRDHTLSNEVFALTECDHCHLLLTNPRPDAQSLTHYYQSADYISHTNTASGIMDIGYLLARQFTLGWKLRLLNRLQQRGKLLDFGCGTGSFLRYAINNDWQAKGVEPSAVAREKGQSLLGKSKKNIFNDLSEIQNEDFDSITLWHVLEHVPDVNTTLQNLKKQLTKDGLIFVAVPNHRCADAHLYAEYWAGYDVPRHLWHFTQATMAQLMANNKLKIKRTIPMRLDAYYVSLLSEKYRNNKKLTPFSACRALINGFRSNWRAKKGLNYSSLIYIAGHA